MTHIQYESEKEEKKFKAIEQQESEVHLKI